MALDCSLVQLHFSRSWDLVLLGEVQFVALWLGSLLSQAVGSLCTLADIWPQPQCQRTHTLGLSVGMGAKMHGIVTNTPLLLSLPYLAHSPGTMHISDLCVCLQEQPGFYAHETGQNQREVRAGSEQSSI